MAKFVNIGTYEATDFDCYGIVIEQIGLDTIFQSFVSYEGNVHHGNRFYTRSEAEDEAKKWAAKLED